MFYANPPPPIKMRLNQFLKVERPLSRTLVDLEERLEKFSHILEGDASFTMPSDEGKEIQIVSDLSFLHNRCESIEKALASLMAFHNRHAGTAEEETGISEEATVEEEGSDRLNIFVRAGLDDAVKAIVGAQQFSKFSEP